MKGRSLQSMNIHTDWILVSGNFWLYSQNTPSTLTQQTNIQQKFIQHMVNAKNILNCTTDSILQIWIFFWIFPLAQTSKFSSILTSSSKVFH